MNIDTNVRRRSLVMLPAKVLLGVAGERLLFGAALYQQSHVSVNHDFANKPTPNWSGGGFVTLDNAMSGLPTFVVYDARGKQVRSAGFSIPGVAHITVLSFAHGDNGAIAFAGNAFDDAGRGAPIVSWIGPDDSVATVVRTNPYYPLKIAIASDGTIWAVGYEYISGERQLNGNAGIFKRWDPAGKVLASYIAQKTVPNAKNSILGLDLLRASKDRVAWFSDRGSRYFEVALDGQATVTDVVPLPGPHMVTGMAVTDNGETFLSYQTNYGKMLVRLNRKLGQWTEVRKLDGSIPAPLFGAQGNQIVCSGSGEGLDILSFSD